MGEWNTLRGKEMGCRHTECVMCCRIWGRQNGVRASGTALVKLSVGGASGMYYAEVYAPTGLVESGSVARQTNERHEVATRDSGGEKRHG